MSDKNENTYRRDTLESPRQDRPLERSFVCREAVACQHVVLFFSGLVLICLRIPHPL